MSRNDAELLAATAAGECSPIGHHRRVLRRKSRDRAVALRLLTAALVEIRAEVNVGDRERARRLAEPFTTRPLNSSAVDRWKSSPM
jgi:hypothetical protein